MQRHLSPQTAPIKKLRIDDSLNDVPLAHTPQVSSSTWPPQPTGVSMRQKRVNMEVLSGSSASAQVTHEAASEGTNVSANSSSASLETSPLPPVIRDRIFEERGKGRWSVTIQLDWFSPTCVGLIHLTLYIRLLECVTHPIVKS